MDNTKIIEQIKKLTQKSKDKKIDWSFVNSNLIRFIKREGLRIFTITLQTQRLARIINTANRDVLSNINYIITIQATNPIEIILQANSATDPLLKDSLSELFTEATNSSTDKTVDVISKLIDNL